jgi:SAM-dependent methyltransferase
MGSLHVVTDAVSSWPLPPDELIDRVVSGFSNEEAEQHRALFLETGRRSLADFQLALAAIGDALAEHARILEFGCGCGRIMRWMDDVGRSSTLVGTDIDARAIEWASDNLSFARFDVNDGKPPTRYADGQFDLILNHSVFTHLDATYQDLWLAELQRITAPEGVLVLSVHGDYAFQQSERQLTPRSRERREWRATLERDGILFVAEDSYVGSAFPDFYHTAFHAPWYVFEHWSRWFDVQAYLPRSSLDFQDQVVLRRRSDAEPAREPIRARPDGASADAAPAPVRPSGSSTDSVLEPSTLGSRYGGLGIAARRALFRLARPVLHAQQDVNDRLGEAIASLDDRIEETREQRMPPLVHIALRQQAMRIDRLESELRRLSATDAELESGMGDRHTPP